MKGIILYNTVEKQELIIHFFSENVYRIQKMKFIENYPVRGILSESMEVYVYCKAEWVQYMTLFVFSGDQTSQNKPVLTMPPPIEMEINK